MPQEDSAKIHLNNRATKQNHYDAIVIGSGISGGWAVKELCEKGLKVLLLERGRNIEHIKDYTNATKNLWELQHRGGFTEKMNKDFPVLKRTGTLNEMNLDFWANEQDNPYTEIKPFDWFRGYQVGGKSLMWGRKSFRLSDFDFEANANEGVAVDWPIRYKDLEPWYTHVEKFVGISGSKQGLSHVPDSHFLPPMELNCVEKDVAERIKKHYKGVRTAFSTPTANLTVPHQGRINCQYRNRCWLGCPFGAYFSTQSSTLPAAFKTNNLTLRPFSIVKKILYNNAKQKATGVEILDTETNQTYSYTAKIVFVNASALNSTWILMNSATDIWPDGLGSSSGELGHNLMDHQLEVGAVGLGDKKFDDKYYFGRKPNGLYIPRFRNIFGDKRDYLRGYGYQGIAKREGWNREISDLSIGAELKEALSEPGSWVLKLMGFGEILPYHENRIMLDKTNLDKWGLPVLAMDAEIKANEKKMRKDMEADAQEMLRIGGLQSVEGFNKPFALGRGIHEMGTARMGLSPKTSVLNKWNQVWDAKNVFVTDGACMTSAACVNPSLTYMALTARACDYAVSELKKNNL